MNKNEAVQLETEYLLSFLRLTVVKQISIRGGVKLEDQDGLSSFLDSFLNRYKDLSSFS